MLTLIYSELLVCTTRFCIQHLWTSLLAKSQVEKLSFLSLYYKTNQHSFSSLHTHWHLWELVSYGCTEITFPNATAKSGRCKWLFQILLCLCSSALGWCIRGSWDVTPLEGEPTVLRMREEPPKSTCSERDRMKHVFCRHLSGFPLWLLWQLLF